MKKYEDDDIRVFWKFVGEFKPIIMGQLQPLIEAYDNYLRSEDPAYHDHIVNEFEHSVKSLIFHIFCKEYPSIEVDKIYDECQCLDIAAYIYEV